MSSRQRCGIGSQDSSCPGIWRLFARLDGAEHLFFSLLYGTGMRLAEGLRLRVKDVDFSTREITVRDGKGGKDRVTVLPESVKAPLLAHLREVRQLHL